MKQKVMIFPSYGGQIPKPIFTEMERLNKSFPDNRYGDIIDFIERTAIPFNDTITIEEYIKNNPDVLVKIKNTYIGKATDYNYLVKAEVIEIDTDKPWMITEYDGAESIAPVPVFKCINTKLNMYVQE